MTRSKTTGNHTAAQAGASPATPICLEISENKKKPNPPTIPVATIVWMPPERNDRNDTVAAKRTMATQSSGRDQQQLVLDLQTYPVESLAFSATSISPGSSQNDTEKTVPRASCTRSGVR